MKSTIYLIILTLLFSCKTDNKTNLKTKVEATQQSEKTALKIETKYVIAKSGLNYRRSPKGEIIGKFKYGEKLEVIEHSNVFENITDHGKIIKGEWLGIKLDNRKVYVFGGYLSNKINTEPLIKAQKKEDLFKILLPFTYRDWENKNPVDHLNKTWLELYKKDSKYYLSKANYNITKGEDACSGSATKTIKSKRETLFFINNTNLDLGEIYSVSSTKTKLCPEDKTSYFYKNIKYTIRAEGDIISSEETHTDNGLELYCEVENYKLCISIKNGLETLFLEQESFNDTFVKLLFVGDIDTDGKLDFIFEANRHYEEKRVLLYLSSEATEKEIIKKVAEISIGFDC